MSEIIPFKTREERERSRAFRSIYIHNVLSGVCRETPSIDEILEFVEAEPWHAFAFGQILLEKHHWQLDNVLAFIRTHYKSKKPAG